MLSSITLMVSLKAPKRGKFKGGEENAILSAPSEVMERWDCGVGTPNPAASRENRIQSMNRALHIKNVLIMYCSDLYLPLNSMLWLPQKYCATEKSATS